MVKYGLQIKTWRVSTSPVHLKDVAGDPPYALVNSRLYEETGTKVWGDINVSQFITTNKIIKKQTLLSKVLNCHITKSNDSQHRTPCQRAQELLGIKHYLDLGKNIDKAKELATSKPVKIQVIAVSQLEIFCAILSWSPQAYCISWSHDQLSVNTKTVRFWKCC